MGKAERCGYLTDVTDEEWSFVLPYLLLSREDNGSASQWIYGSMTAI
jgi:hypothetical protein